MGEEGKDGREETHDRKKSERNQERKIGENRERENTGRKRRRDRERERER